MIRRMMLVSGLLLLGFALPFPSVAQEATPVPKITPLWTSTQKFCPTEDYCRRMWRLSADGEHLFVYVVPTTTMYVYAKGKDNVTSYKVLTYPATNFPESFDQEFDYFPREL